MHLLRPHIYFTFFVIALWLGGCSDGSLEDPRFPTGSHSLIASSDYNAVYSVNVDNDSISRVDLATHEVTEYAAGREPTRLARANGKVFVTLRGERGLAVFAEKGAGLELVDTVSTGAEPYGIVASEDGDRIYLALSTENRIEERDGHSLKVLREWTVGDEPRWLALHPSGDALYVASAMAGRLTYINLDKKKSMKAIKLPRIDGFGGMGEPHPLSIRLTGDPAVLSDGSVVVVPGFYVDNEDPVPSNEEVHTSLEEEEADDDPFFNEDPGGYGSGGRFNPVVVEVPVSDEGEPDSSTVTVVGITSFVFDDSFGGNNPGPSDFTDTTIGSYPTSITPSPQGRILMVTMESSRAVVAVRRQSEGEGFSIFDVLLDNVDGSDSENFFDFRETMVVETDAGPRGVAFVPGKRVFVQSFLDRSLMRINMKPIHDLWLNDDSGDSDFFGDEFAVGFGGEALKALPVATLAPAVLSSDVDTGRRLFYSATDSRMSTHAAGVSCSACHLDSRNDGLTWHFADGVRQTPSLAGKISLTAPVTWFDDVETVADEVMVTSQGRMGGSGLENAEANQVATFIDWSRDVDVPLKQQNTEEIALGQQLFESEAVGCGECHYGAMMTDNEMHRISGKLVRTRSLVGIAATAPYLHDGSTKTVAELLELCRSGFMGNTSGLSASEMKALEAYVNSL